jgi:hypothetical protein
VVEAIGQLRESIDDAYRALRDYGAFFFDSRHNEDYSSFHDLLKDAIAVGIHLTRGASTRGTLISRAQCDKTRLGKRRACELLLTFLMSACFERHARNATVATENQNFIEAPHGNYIARALVVDWIDDGMPFSQAPFDVPAPGSHSGLGMYLARRYARASGGDLQYLSNSRGVMLRMILPVATE